MQSCSTCGRDFEGDPCPVCGGTWTRRMGVFAATCFLVSAAAFIGSVFINLSYPLLQLEILMPLLSLIPLLVPLVLIIIVRSRKQFARYVPRTKQVYLWATTLLVLSTFFWLFNAFLGP